MPTHSYQPITISDEERRIRRLAVVILNTAREDAANESLTPDIRIDAQLFLLGASGYYHMLELWAGVLGIRAKTVQRWAVGKGYHTGRVTSLTPALRRQHLALSGVSGLTRRSAEYTYHWTPAGVAAKRRKRRSRKKESKHQRVADRRPVSQPEETGE